MSILDSKQKSCQVLWNFLVIELHQNNVKTVQIRRFFWSVFSRVRNNGDLLRKSSYSVRIHEERTRKNSVFGYFLRSESRMISEITSNVPMFCNPASNSMFKVKNRNTRTRGEICSKLTIKTPERR